MKTRTKKRGICLVSLLLMMFFSILAVQVSHAHDRYYKKVPVAICSTGGTNIPLPYFVCCQLLDVKGQPVWQNTWVPTSCKNADVRAVFDMGCKTSSPVYGLGSAVLGNCQFSHSTGKYL